jgi:hypothetical protein
VQEIVGKERAVRTDLPASHPKSISKVRRQGCYYVVVEEKLSEVPGQEDRVILDADNVFVLNQYGVIVDASSGNAPILQGTRQGKGCPGKTMTEAELKEIVRKERAIRKDLAPRIPNVAIQVDRVRCLYLYYEHDGPVAKGKYVVFEIDPFGGVMHVSRSDPH